MTSPWPASIFLIVPHAQRGGSCFFAAADASPTASRKTRIRLVQVVPIGVVLLEKLFQTEIEFVVSRLDLDHQIGGSCVPILFRNRSRVNPLRFRAIEGVGIGHD